MTYIWSEKLPESFIPCRSGFELEQQVIHADVVQVPTTLGTCLKYNPILSYLSFKVSRCFFWRKACIHQPELYLELNAHRLYLESCIPRELEKAVRVVHGGGREGHHHALKVYKIISGHANIFNLVFEVIVTQSMAIYNSIHSLHLVQDTNYLSAPTH